MLDETPEMPGGAADLPPDNGSDQTRKLRRPRGLRTLDDLDGRTRVHREAVEFRDALIAERGGADHLDAMRLSLIESFAITTAMVRDIQIRWLAGEPDVTDIAGLVALINARGREAALVGEPRPKDVTDLSSYLEAKRRKETS